MKLMKQCLGLNVCISWLSYACKFKNDLYGSFFARLGIIHYVAAQDLTKDPSSNGKCDHTFSHLVPVQGRLGAISLI